MQPKFRLFDNKTENGGVTATSTTVVQNENQTKSSPKDVSGDDQSLDTSTVQQLNNPSSNPPKSQKQNKSNPSLLSLPIELPQILPSCNEEKKSEYEAVYQHDVEAENALHDSEIARILNLGLLDELLTQDIDAETVRHKTALSDLKSTLDNLLKEIAC